MRIIKRATNFKKDFKRVMATPRHSRDVGPLLEDILAFLVADEALPENYLDHALVGNWKGHRECHRECHIKPDLLLIYKTEELDKLHLVRLGSHSELFKR